MARDSPYAGDREALNCGLSSTAARIELLITHDSAVSFIASRAPAISFLGSEGYSGLNHGHLHQFQQRRFQAGFVDIRFQGPHRAIRSSAQVS